MTIPTMNLQPSGARPSFDGFELDEVDAHLTREGQAVPIQPRHFAVLCALARRPGHLMTKAALRDAVWGHRFLTDSVFKSAISEVRAALHDDPRQPRYIETVPRRGYRFIGLHESIFRTILVVAMLLAHSFAGAQDLGKPMADAGKSDGNWYFSWGYSRQQYADSDIHVRQPSEGSDFVVHQAKASDDPTGLFHIVRSIFKLNFTAPQENIRVGRFVNQDNTFAIEFSLDHSKYNTNNGQVAHVTGTVEGVAYDGPMTLDDQHFRYALHNGLNHVMINGVWFHHLRDISLWHEPGDLQLVSRLGGGLLIPHAENTILGHDNSTEMGTKDKNPCCSKHDWWQINGWTVGTEVGFRYAMTRSVYAELTQKFAYGKLHGVPVFHGLASQEIWMSEQVLSLGLLF